MANDFILDCDEHGEFYAIPLKSKYGDFFAKIDCCDFEDISRYNWRLWWRKGYEKRYAVRNLPRKDGKRKTMKMHRQILGIKDGILADHEDGDGLNNRRFNLRVATQAQNQHNQGPRKGTSRFKGVHWSETHNKWCAQIKYLCKCIWIGSFPKEIVNDVDIGEIKAAKAYDEAARKYFGVFARLNFPEGKYMGYMLDQKVEQEALKLIAQCKADSVTDTAVILSQKTVLELEIMCKYLGCNISRLAGRVLSFSKGLQDE